VQKQCLPSDSELAAEHHLQVVDGIQYCEIQFWLGRAAHTHSHTRG